MPIVAAIPAITALAGTTGAVLGNTAKARTGTQRQSSNWSQQTEHIENPMYSALSKALIDQYTGMAQKPVDMQAIEARGLQDIGMAYGGPGGVEAQLENRLAQSGIEGPMAEAARLQASTARSGQQAQFLQTLPMVEDELMRQRLESATKFWALRPVDVKQTGTSQGEGSQTLPGSASAAGFNTGAQMLAYLYGSGMFGGGQKQQGYSV